MMLELCPNQTLFELIKRRGQLHQLEAQAFSLQIISALQYMHQNQIVHRDMKPGNLLLGHNLEIKVGDFGLAAKINF